MDFVLTIDNPTLSFGNKSRSIWVTSADGSKKAVLMSLVSEADQVNHIRISERKGIEVGQDFSYNNKSTKELKSELKESENYVAVMKAQPVPPRKELSFQEKEVAVHKALIDIRNGKTEFQQTADEIVADTPDAKLATEATIKALTDSGIEVVEATDEMAMAVLGNSAEMMAKKKRALETVSVQETEHQQTAISSADGAKVLNNLDNLDNLAEEYDKNPKTEEKTFIGVVANALGIDAQGKSSKYATFEAKNEKLVTIRLSNHNAKVSNFDNNEEVEGISIVVSAKGNNGITNDGEAHIVEHYYDAIKLRRAEANRYSCIHGYRSIFIQKSRQEPNHSAYLTGDYQLRRDC